MGKTYAILDSTGTEVGTHTGGGDSPPGHCPIQPPPGGSIVEVPDADSPLVMALHKGGQTIEIDNQKSIKANGVVVGRIAEEKK